MKRRTVRAESITAGVVLREEAVAPPVFRRSGHCMSGPVAESLRRAVEVPGLWTPGRRRAESEGRRGGRPQALGSLAGDRCRPCLRWGRETPTLPQRIVILAMINPEDEGVTSQPEYTLSKPSNCPNHRDHFTFQSADVLPEEAARGGISPLCRAHMAMLLSYMRPMQSRQHHIRVL